MAIFLFPGDCEEETQHRGHLLLDVRHDDVLHARSRTSRLDQRIEPRQDDHDRRA